MLGVGLGVGAVRVADGVAGRGAGSARGSAVQPATSSTSAAPTEDLPTFMEVQRLVAAIGSDVAVVTPTSTKCTNVTTTPERGPTLSACVCVEPWPLLPCRS